jgi:hypothetical protein
MLQKEHGLCPAGTGEPWLACEQERSRLGHKGTHCPLTALKKATSQSTLYLLFSDGQLSQSHWECL